MNIETINPIRDKQVLLEILLQELERQPRSLRSVALESGTSIKALTNFINGKDIKPITALRLKNWLKKQTDNK